MRVDNYSDRRKQFYIFMIVAVLIFLLAIMIKFFLQQQAQIINSQGKQVINADTKIVSEISFICGNKFNSEIPAQQLLGIDYQGLMKRFPKEEGWTIENQDPKNIKISKTEQQLCPLHKNYRHLGIDKGNVVLFEGPLGYNNLILQQEGIKINKLPVEWQEKLKQAMNYKDQTEKNKNELKKVLEFSSDIGISEVLENINEYNR